MIEFKFCSKKILKKISACRPQNFCLKIFLFCFFFLTGSHLIAAKTPSRLTPAETLVIASAADARTLLPILASDSVSAEICGLLYNGLVKYDSELNLVGDLAQDWEIREDGKIIIFHLRHGVKWHDGEDFTAQDVLFTFECLIHPLTPTPYSGDFLKVASLEIPDAHTVVVTYHEPFSPGLASWGIGMIPEHLWKNKDLQRISISHKTVVGTGPFTLKKWVKQSSLELLANQDYFEGPPKIGRMIFKIIPDPSTLFLELQTEGVDISSLTPLQFSKQTVNRFFADHYNKFRQKSFGYTYLGFNLTDTRFQDPAIREAFDLAINREELIKIVLLGLGSSLSGPFLPQSWAYDPSIQPTVYDPQKSKKLLLQAGWRDTNQDGWIEKDGAIFEFTLLTNQGNDSRIKTAELIQSYLRKIGVKVKIKILEWGTLLENFLEPRRFEAVILGWSLGMDPDNFDIWHSSKTKKGEFNFISYANPQVDALLTQGRRTFDKSLRKEIYHKIHALIRQDRPYLFLYMSDSLSIFSSRIQGLDPAPAGLWHNLIEWWVPYSLQKYKNKI